MGGPGSGPVPKSVRLGHGAAGVPTSNAPKGIPITWPGPQVGWHPTATEIYLSLRDSGQSAFFEQSDVAVACMLGDMITMAFKKQSAVMFGQVNDLLDSLMATAGARKRMRIELGGPSAEVAPSIGKLAKYKVIAGSEAKTG